MYINYTRVYQTPTLLLFTFHKWIMELLWPCSNLQDSAFRAWLKSVGKIRWPRSRILEKTCSCNGESHCTCRVKDYNHICLESVKRNKKSKDANQQSCFRHLPQAEVTHELRCLSLPIPFKKRLTLTAQRSGFIVLSFQIYTVSSQIPYLLILKCRHSSTMPFLVILTIWRQHLENGQRFTTGHIIR